MVVVPDNEIIGYALAVKSLEKWYHIYAERSGTSINLVSYYSGTMQVWENNPVISVPRFYPIQLTDNLGDKAQEVLSKLKGLIIFT